MDERLGDQAGFMIRMTMEMNWAQASGSIDDLEVCVVCSASARMHTTRHPHGNPYPSPQTTMTAGWEVSANHTA